MKLNVAVPSLQAICAYTHPNYNPGYGQTAGWAASLAAYNKLLGVTVNMQPIFPSWQVTNASGKMESWPGNLGGYLSGIIAGGYSPTKFIPIVSSKLFSVGVPGDGGSAGYGWCDKSTASAASNQAKNDIITGKYDAVWQGYVQQLAQYGFTNSFFRFYEQNFQFMNDAPGWDAASQALERQAIGHAFSVMAAEAAVLNINVFAGVCYASGSGGMPLSALVDDTVAGLSQFIGMDIYNQNYCSSNPLTATSAQKIQCWQNRDGVAGINQIVALAKKYGLPILVCENGTGPSKVAVNDDPDWVQWLVSMAQYVRSQGVAFLGIDIWNCVVGDGSWAFDNGAQPTVLSQLQAAFAQGSTCPLVGDNLAAVFGGTVPLPSPPPPPSGTQSFGFIQAINAVVADPFAVTVTATQPISSLADLTYIAATSETAAPSPLPTGSTITNGGLTVNVASIVMPAATAGVLCFFQLQQISTGVNSAFIEFTPAATATSPPPPPNPPSPQAFTVSPISGVIIGEPFSVSAVASVAVAAMSDLEFIANSDPSAAPAALPVGSTVSSDGFDITVNGIVNNNGLLHTFQLTQVSTGIKSPVRTYTPTVAAVSAPPGQVLTVEPIVPALGTPFNVTVAATVPIASLSDLVFIANSNPNATPTVLPAGSTISENGLTVTVVGILNSNSNEHTFQITQLSTGIKSQAVSYTP